MSDYNYDFCKNSKLILKSEKRKKKSKNDKNKKKTKKDDNKISEDSLIHGGWWCLNDFASLTGSICVEVLPRQYLRALDDGTFIIGNIHEINEGPDQEEVLTCIRATENKISLKSGYNKYLSIDSSNRLIGRSDAISSRELFEPVFENEKLAILACNNNFLSYDKNENKLFFSSKTASFNEFVKIRSNVDPEKIKKDFEESKIADEEKGDLNDCEQKYLKKFQASQKKSNLTIKESGVVLKKAKNEGNLHEVLLDRRSKIKSDKFCK